MEEKWTNVDNVSLACHKWCPSSKPSFLMYIVHGYGDHAGRYSKLAEYVNSFGGIVYSHDHFAHGKSGPYDLDSPNRCQAQNLHAVVRDVADRITIVSKLHPDLKVFVYGHSFGGLIALQFALDYADLFQYLIIQSPALIAHSKSAGWLLILVARILNYIFPNYKLPDGGEDKVSRDPQAVQDLENDELASDNGGITVRMAVNMLNMAEHVMPNLHQIKQPTFIASGTDDYILDPSGCDLCAKLIDVNTYKLYDGAYHSLHVELDETRLQYFNDLVEWIKIQIPTIMI